MSARWYVVRTKAWHEIQTGANLRARGIDVFVPRVAVAHPRRDRRAFEPLFRCYLFARIDVDGVDWATARTCPGVAYVIGTSAGPSAVPEDLVEQIRLRCDRRATPAPFQTGDRVRITMQPFCDVEAIFDKSLSASGRVRVFLEMVERLVPFDLDASFLRQVSPLSQAS